MLLALFENNGRKNGKHALMIPTEGSMNVHVAGAITLSGHVSAMACLREADNIQVRSLYAMLPIVMIRTMLAMQTLIELVLEGPTPVAELTRNLKRTSLQPASSAEKISAAAIAAVLASRELSHRSRDSRLRCPMHSVINFHKFLCWVQDDSRTYQQDDIGRCT